MNLCPHNPSQSLLMEHTIHHMYYRFHRHNSDTLSTHHNDPQHYKNNPNQGNQYETDICLNLVSQIENNEVVSRRMLALWWLSSLKS